MPVIYEDQTQTGLGGFATALGQALSGGIQQQVTANAVAQAKNMDPQARSAYLIQKLGPEGAKLADSITQAQVDASTLTLNALKTTDASLQVQMDKLTAANQPTVIALANKKAMLDNAATQAETAARIASAANDYAGANAANAQASMYRAETAIDQTKANAQLEAIKGIHALAAANGDPQAASNLLSNDPQFPGGVNGKPAPTPPGGIKPNTDPSSVVNQAQTTLNYALGNADQTALNAAYPPDNVNGKLSQGQLVDAELNLASGNFAGAGTALQNKPLAVKMEERAPGVFQNYATYQNPDSDGWVGRPIYRPKPTPPKFEQLAQGVDSWLATNKALSTLSQIPVGGRISRQLQQQLVSVGIDPSQYGNTNTAILFDTVVAHASLAARNLAGAGGSIGYKNLQVITDTLPKFTDDPNIKAAKLNAGNALLDTAVRPAVLNLQASGYVIPPSLGQIFKDRDLLSKDVDQEAAGYLVGSGAENASNDGAGGLVTGADEGAGNAGDSPVNTGAGGAGEGGESGEGAGGGDGSTASGNDRTSSSSDGWTNFSASDDNQ
jgi:hypothetical protein